MQEFLQDDLTLLAVPLDIAALLLEMRYARSHGLDWFRRGDTIASQATHGQSLIPTEPTVTHHLILFCPFA